MRYFFQKHLTNSLLNRYMYERQKRSDVSLHGETKNPIEVVLLLLHDYRGELKSILRSKGKIEDVEDAISLAIEKIANQLHTGDLLLDKPSSEYRKLFTTISKNKLVDLQRYGPGKQKKRSKDDLPPPIEPIDIRHRAPNRLRELVLSELASNQDVFTEATRKDAIHAYQALLDDVLAASTKANRKVILRYLWLLVTTQGTVTQADVARECNMSRANITITLKKVREDATKRHPGNLKTYNDLFAV